MADKTRIGWTDATWSPVSGCTKISAGCEHCYIDRTPPFRIERRTFDKPGIGATTGVRLHSERLGQPQHWRKGRRVFVCSMADLFHDEVPDSYIAEVWAVMSLCPQHTFQVLTKRAGRMRSVLSSGLFWVQVNAARMARGVSVLPGGGPVCLPNVWIGVSAETQHWADVRIPLLLHTPAAVRWVSSEPLLGPITMTNWLHRPGGEYMSLDWVVVGGESGPGARPMDPVWAHDLVVQCRDRDVPVFMKQMGSAWARDNCNYGEPISRTDKAGSKLENMPFGLRIREWPRTAV